MQDFAISLIWSVVHSDDNDVDLFRRAELAGCGHPPLISATEMVGFLCAFAGDIHSPAASNSRAKV